MGKFGKETSADEVVGMFGGRIRGRVVLITGVGSNGLGSTLAQALSTQSPSLLILASRTLSKLHTTVGSIHKLNPSCPCIPIHLDLESLSSIRTATQEISTVLKKYNTKIDVLFNNAGVNLSQRRITEQGIDAQMGINYLGPWFFTDLLIQSGALDVTGGRVVNVSSEAHRMAGVRFSELGDREGEEVEEVDEKMVRYLKKKGFLLGGDGEKEVYQPWIAYARSKTADILFSVALRRRGVSSFAVHPGNIWTDLTRDMDKITMKPFESSKPEEWKTVEQGAATIAVAGFDPDLSPEKGIYLDDCQFRWPKRWATDPEKAERLWRISEQLVGEKFDFDFSKKGKSHL